MGLFVSGHYISFVQVIVKVQQEAGLYIEALLDHQIAVLTFIPKR